MTFIIKDTTTTEEIAAAIRAGEKIVVSRVNTDEATLEAEANEVRTKSIRTISRCFGIIVGVGIGLAVAPLIINLFNKE